MVEKFRGYEIYDHGGNRIEVRKDGESWKVEVNGTRLSLIVYDNENNDSDDLQVDSLPEDVRETILESSTFEKYRRD